MSAPNTTQQKAQNIYTGSRIKETTTTNDLLRHSGLGTASMSLTPNVQRRFTHPDATQLLSLPYVHKTNLHASPLKRQSPVQGTYSLSSSLAHSIQSIIIPRSRSRKSQAHLVLLYSARSQPVAREAIGMGLCLDLCGLS